MSLCIWRYVRLWAFAAIVVATIAGDQRWVTYELQIDGEKVDDFLVITLRGARAYAAATAKKYGRQLTLVEIKNDGQRINVGVFGRDS